MQSRDLCLGSSCSIQNRSSVFGISNQGQTVGTISQFPVTLNFLTAPDWDAETSFFLDPETILDPALNYDGSQFLFSSSDNELSNDDYNPGTDVYTKSIGQEDPRLISALEDGLPILGHNHDPVYGPDGNFILFKSNAGPEIGLFLYDSDLGYAMKITDIGENAEYAIDQSGRFIAFTSTLDFNQPRANNRSRLWLFDRQHNQMILKGSSTQNLINPHISADGKTLLVVAERDDAKQLGDQIFLIENQQHVAQIELK